MRKLIFFAFLAFLSFTAALGCKGQATEHIKVVLKKYSFDPPVIKVKSGDNIELELSAADVQHGFSVPQLGIKEAVQPGQPADDPEIPGTQLDPVQHARQERQSLLPGQEPARIGFQRPRRHHGAHRPRSSRR